MQTNTSQNISAADALWTLYMQQNEQIRKAFLIRVRQTDKILDMPGIYSREDIVKESKKRMQDIIDGKEKTLSHEEVLQMIDKAIKQA